MPRKSRDRHFSIETRAIFSFFSAKVKREKCKGDLFCVGSGKKKTCTNQNPNMFEVFKV